MALDLPSPASPLPYTREEQAAGRLAAAAVAFGIFLLICLTPKIFNDGDTGWHLATGQQIIASQAIPAVDSLSFTAAGAPWTAHEWLAEVVMAGLFAAGGWPLLSVALAALIGGLVLIIGHELARWLAPPKVLLILLLVIAMLMPSMLIRPHAFAWPLLAGWTVVMLDAREAGRAPPMAAAGLMLVWANLHGSFILGLGIAGLFGLEALIMTDDRRGVLIGWGRFGAVALLAAIVTPHGPAGLMFPLMVSRMSTLGLIKEWEPTSFSSHLTFSLPLMLALFVMLWRGVRVPPVRLLLLCILFYMAMLHARHHQVLAIVGSLVLAAPLGIAFGRQPAARPTRRLLPVLLAGLAIALFVRLGQPNQRPPSAEHPGAAIAALPAELRRQPVMNEYGFGGSLILAGIAPFIDGRADLYGDDFLNAHSRIARGDAAAFDRAVARWGISWTIFRPDTPIVARLDADPAWRRIYADQWAVVHVRRPPG